MSKSCLDLFCGPGGASKGLHNAGFDVTGVDIIKQNDYPYHFIRKDIFNLNLDFIKEFDLIWASPPCQGYLPTNLNNPNCVRLIGATRFLLKQIGKPFVIENVPSDNIRCDLMLCGEMFKLKILRHRFFEVEGFGVPRLPHKDHKGTVANADYIGVYEGTPGNPRTKKKYGGLPKFTFADMKNALGIDWVKTKIGITEMIPPKYSEYIGKCFIEPPKSLEAFLNA